jgi:hypothetical protein
MKVIWIWLIGDEKAIGLSPLPLLQTLQVLEEYISSNYNQHCKGQYNNKFNRD